jgi:hypothetical protein
MVPFLIDASLCVRESGGTPTAEWQSTSDINVIAASSDDIAKFS